VKSEFHRPLAVGDIASRVGLSRSRFETLFKRETGSHFKTYIRRVRLTEAKALLGNRRLRIKEVAFHVGYCWTPNFSRDFKNLFGTTPSHFRRYLAGDLAKE